MAARRRGKRNCTLRFKPDLWGRVPESEGTVLFDGTVTLMDNDGEGLYAPVSISEPLVLGNTVTMTFGDESFTGTVTEPSPNVLAVLFDEEGTINIGTIESDTMIGVPYSMGTEGETVAVKVVQSE